MGGPLAAVLPFVPSILGAIGSLFKGKKTQYANQMTPEQQAVYSQMLKMLQRQAGSGSAGYKPTSDALAMLYKTFLPGMSYTPSTGGYNYGQTATSVTPRTLRQPGATGRAGR